MTEESLLSDDKRFCINCGSTTTYTRKTGREQWYKSKLGNGLFCSRCGDKLIWNVEKNESGYRKIFDSKRLNKRMTFKNTRLRNRIVVRRGVCSNCGKKVGDKYNHCRGYTAVIKYTVLHHFEYHKNDPLKDTVELCQSCHSKIHHPKLNLITDTG